MLEIKVDAQEIGRLYADKTTPDGYQQFLLGKLREAGGPVEGTLKLTLAHGKFLRFKRNDPGEFRYMWLAEAEWSQLQSMGGLQ